MGENWYICRDCGYVQLRVFRGVSLRCEIPACDGPLVWSPQPGDFTMDARSDGGTNKSFQKFTVDVDGSPVEIDSLHTLRTVERESEQRCRNGEGEPLRFRMWNQTHSNREVNSFGDAGTIGGRTYDSGTPAPASPKVAVRKHGPTKPRVPLGPGLSRAKSPLKG